MLTYFSTFFNVINLSVTTQLVNDIILQLVVSEDLWYKE